MTEAGPLGPGVPPTTPLEWVWWMNAKLEMRRHTVREYQRYYDSEERTLAFAQQKFAEEFGGLFTEWRDNFCSLVVDSISERLVVNGFRMTDAPDADKDAKEIWQRNCMDVESNAAHIDALVGGESYLIVWADEKDYPTITAEAATEVVIQYKPGSRREILTALKKYYDDWGNEYSTLWTPTGVYQSNRNGTTAYWSDVTYKPNPLGVVPVIPLTNRARLKRHNPYSELHPIIPLQNAITKIAADAIVASEFAAYPQRLISGIEIPEDSDGHAVSPIKSAIDRLLMFESPDVNWGQFQAADLSNYTTLIEMFVQHISTISRVPPHYFLVGGTNFPSGEALIAAEAGLVAKAQERMIYFGEAWEQAMRLAFKVMNDPRSEAFSAETIWADPEYRSDSQRVDALVKLNQGLMVPQRQLWEDYGYTPSQIARFGEMQDEEHKQEMQRQKDLQAIAPPPVAGQPASKSLKAPQGNAGNNNRKNNNA